ncbi:hypothetical protein [Leptolyngbya phage Lbo-JY46]
MAQNCGCTEIEVYNLTQDCIPCEDNRCSATLDSACVIYRDKQESFKSQLTCLGLSTGVSLQSILEKIDDVLCTIDNSQSDLLFENGLTRILNRVTLGGSLVENTTISLGSNVFSINGEDFRLTSYPNTRNDSSPLNMLFTTSTGRIQSALISSLQNNVFSSHLTFNNGLTRTDNLVQLGGDLIKPTIIGETNSNSELNTNTLLIKNNVGIGDLAPGVNFRLVGVHNSTSGRQNINPAYFDKVILDNVPTGDTYGIIGIQSTRGTSNLNFTGLINAGIVGRFSYSSDSTNITGNVNAIQAELGVGTPNISTPGGGDIDSFTGLRVGGIRQSQQGGTYTGEIDNIYGIYLEDLRGSVDNSVVINNRWGVYQEGSNDFNWLKGNSAVGIESPSPEWRLKVSNYGKFEDGINPQHSFKIHITSDNDNPSRGDRYETHGHRSSLYSSNNLFGVEGDIISASFSSTLFTSPNTSLKNTTNKGKISSYLAKSYLAGEIKVIPEGGPNPTVTDNNGTIEKVIGLRIDTPQQIETRPDIAVADYTGTIADTYGIYLETQNSDVYASTNFNQTRTWGVYQAGNTDKNLFNGMTGWNIIPEYSLHAVNRNTSENTVGYFLNNKTIQTDTRELLFGLQGVTSLSGTTKSDDFTTTSGLYGQINLTHTGNYTRNDGDFKSILSGVTGYITAQSTGGNKLTGIISGVASGINLINDYDFSKIAGFYVRSPYSGLGVGDEVNTLYAGTIDNYYGLLIEDFGSGSLGTGTVTNKWGVYQEGTSSRNYFGGRMRLNTASIPTFNNDTDAGSGGLIAGDIYKKSSGELMIKL